MQHLCSNRKQDLSCLYWILQTQLVDSDSTASNKFSMSESSKCNNKFLYHRADTASLPTALSCKRARVSLESLKCIFCYIGFICAIRRLPPSVFEHRDPAERAEATQRRLCSLKKRKLRECGDGVRFKRSRGRIIIGFLQRQTIISQSFLLSNLSGVL